MSGISDWASMISEGGECFDSVRKKPFLRVH